jgi:hypothetical protein
MKRIVRTFATLGVVWVGTLEWAGAQTTQASQWPMRSRDVANSGRADFIVPANRMGTNFFDTFRWQKRTPGSPGQGNLGSRLGNKWAGL